MGRRTIIAGQLAVEVVGRDHSGRPQVAARVGGAADDERAARRRARGAELLQAALLQGERHLWLAFLCVFWARAATYSQGSGIGAVYNARGSELEGV